MDHEIERAIEDENEAYFIDAFVDIGSNFFSVTVGPQGLRNWGRAWPCSCLAEADYVRFEFSRSTGDLLDVESNIDIRDDSVSREAGALADAAKEYFRRLFE